ncbi:MAG: hypothetical protein RLZ98_552 [Pseudomonadota bacterium]|jgi:DNA-binding transcriptional MerR regulator
MSKAAEAFRTISEVADELEIAKHVLRFWENRFPQIKPMKRGGGRRYYRPEDMDLLRGIRHLLHNEGYTIRGVQKILKQQGVETVKQCWQSGAPRVAADGANPGAAGRKKASGKIVSMTSRTARKSGHGKLSRSAVMAAAIRELEVCRELLAQGDRSLKPRRRSKAGP